MGRIWKLIFVILIVFSGQRTIQASIPSSTRCYGACMYEWICVRALRKKGLAKRCSGGRQYGPLCRLGKNEHSVSWRVRRVNRTPLQEPHEARGNNMFVIQM
jgi:hypothetical protein